MPSLSDFLPTFKAPTVKDMIDSFDFTEQNSYWKIIFVFGFETIILPINPSEIMVHDPGDNKSESIIKLGEVTIIRQKKLSSFKIKSFFPHTNEKRPYVNTAGIMYRPPAYYLNLFKRMRRTLEPIRVIIPAMFINQLCSIEDINWGKIAADDDTQYEIDLKEYKPFNAIQGIITEVSANPNASIGENIKNKINGTFKSVKSVIFPK